MCTDQKNSQNYFLVQFDSERMGGVGFFHPVIMSVRVANEICERVGPNNDILGFFFPIVLKNKTISNPTDAQIEACISTSCYHNDESAVAIFEDGYEDDYDREEQKDQRVKMSEEDDEEDEEWEEDGDFSVSKLVQRTQEMRPEMQGKKKQI